MRRHCLWIFYVLVLLDVCSANWRSLRIRPILYNVERLNQTQIQWLNRTITLSVNRMQQLLNIYDGGVKLSNASSNLLLPRKNYCKTEDSEGRCSQLLATYQDQGQKCSSNVDFQIPDKHLVELVTYQRGRERYVHKQQGIGVADADFVMYITSLSVGDCLSLMTVNAYSSPCTETQINSTSIPYRPLAGYVNICPSLLTSDNESNGKILATVLHEFVHALGFSFSVFQTYQHCTESDPPSCNNYSFKEMISQQDKVYYVRTPTVLKFALNHFKCKLGVPLKYSSSHWDPIFMYSSLMQPTIRTGHDLFLDDATLGVLQDSGWYKVSGNLSDRMLWGWQSGCEFHKKCDSSNEMFCNPKITQPTCDYFHQSIGTCTLVPKSDSCYTIVGNSSCSGDKRCFVVSEQPMCLSVDCSDTNYTVSHPKYGDIVCQKSDSISQSKFGVLDNLLTTSARSLECPPYRFICPPLTSVLDLYNSDSITSTVATSSSSSTSASSLSTSPTTLPKSSTVQSSTVQQTLTSSPSSISSSASITTSPLATTTKLPFLLFRAFIAVIAFTKHHGVYADVINDARTTTESSAPKVSNVANPKKQPATPRPGRKVSKKFEVRFKDMNYQYYEARNLLDEIKMKVRDVLATKVFGIPETYINIVSVRSGSVVVVFENTHPDATEEATLNTLKQKISAIKITMDGQVYGASSVGYEGESTDESDNIPLTEIIVGSVVGGLLFIGLILVVALTITKHKLKGVRQVRPGGGTSNSSPPSSNTSREPSAIPAPASARQSVGLASGKHFNLADVEAPGRSSNSEARQHPAASRGISAGSIQMAFSSSALYFEETV